MDFEDKTQDFKETLCCEITLVGMPAITPDTWQDLSLVSCILEFITLGLMLSENLAALTFVCALAWRPTIMEDPSVQGVYLVLGSKPGCQAVASSKVLSVSFYRTTVALGTLC